jgi:hypothetical protein
MEWIAVPLHPNLPSTSPFEPAQPNLSSRINRIILPCSLTIFSVHFRYCRSSLGTRVN